MTEEGQQPHERIFNILFQEDELTWQNMIYDLVREQEMNPWDINITLIAQKFLEKLKNFKEMDFRISGKIVLASAMMLKMKSTRLLEQDLANFDQILAGSDEEDAMEILEELQKEYGTGATQDDLPKIRPKIPQPRKRKVSVFDLVEALEQALEVENRRKVYIDPEAQLQAPKKGMDITLVIKDVYDKVISFFSKKDSEKKVMLFSQLIPSESKEDKVFTFIPLLHLDFQRKIDLIQEEHFGDISIVLNKGHENIKT